MVHSGWPASWRKHPVTNCTSPTRGAQADTPTAVGRAVTRFTGSMTFVYVHLLVFGLWIFTSSGWAPWANFDPTFVGLATFASVEAIFLSTFVLITQNRMTRRADKRADLDLQISLWPNTK